MESQELNGERKKKEEDDKKIITWTAVLKNAGLGIPSTVSEQIALFLLKNEWMSDSLKKRF